MNVFLSWSGEYSKQLATVLREFLVLVFPDVQFWVSSQDIQAGQRWRDELDRQLESTDFGVLCLVPTNLMSPWLLFEAGALSKSVAAGRVVPYCAGFQAEDVSGPLAGFQGVSADEAGTQRLVASINSLLGLAMRTDTLLTKTFAKWWPELQTSFASIMLDVQRGPSQVRVRRILCAATTQFMTLGAEEDIRILENSYPNCVRTLRNVRLSELLDALLPPERFEIVHLLGYV